MNEPGSGDGLSMPQLGEKEILEVTEPIDLKKVLGDKRVIFVADSHTSTSDKEAFKAELPQLAELGITDLALEMLPKGFPTEDPEKVREYFNLHWHKGRNMGDNYFAVYNRARELGMRVWGIDISIEEYQSQSLSASFKIRNQQWANVIKSQLSSDPKIKVAVFHGMSHAGYYPAGDRVNNILKNKGLSSVVVHNYGGDHQDTLTSEEKMMHRLLKEKAINKPFMVSVTTPSRSADYMIHSPASKI